MEGTSVGHLGQPSCQSMVTQSRLHRTLSRWVLNISREGDSTASLGSLGQGSVTLRVKKFFFIFRRNFLCFTTACLTANTSHCTAFTVEVTAQSLFSRYRTERLRAPAHGESDARREPLDRYRCRWLVLYRKTPFVLLFSLAHEGSTPFSRQQAHSSQYAVSLQLRTFSSMKTETFGASFQVHSKGDPPRTYHYCVATTACSDWGEVLSKLCPRKKKAPKGKSPQLGCPHARLQPPGPTGFLA